MVSARCKCFLAIQQNKLTQWQVDNLGDTICGRLRVEHDRFVDICCLTQQPIENIIRNINIRKQFDQWDVAPVAVCNRKQSNAPITYQTL